MRPIKGQIPYMILSLLRQGLFLRKKKRIKTSSKRNPSSSLNRLYPLVYPLVKQESCYQKEPLEKTDDTEPPFKDTPIFRTPRRLISLYYRKRSRKNVTVVIFCVFFLFKFTFSPVTFPERSRSFLWKVSFILPSSAPAHQG